MNKQELIDWFWDKYNSCYPVVHSDYPDVVFLYYDNQFVRKIKLAKISGVDIGYPNKVSGVCIFEQDWKNKKFYYDYDEIYLFLKKNYINNYDKIKEFIDDRLKEADKLSVLTTIDKFFSFVPKLKEADKLSVLTTFTFGYAPEEMLKDADKLSVLTTTKTLFADKLGINNLSNIN